MRLLPVLLAVIALGLPLLAQQPQPILPDSKLTPGDAFEVSASDVCTPGYANKVRNVPQVEKEQVYREYGITQRHRGDYEIRAFTGFGESLNFVRAKILSQTL